MWHITCAHKFHEAISATKCDSCARLLDYLHRKLPHLCTSLAVTNFHLHQLHSAWYLQIQPLCTNLCLWVYAKYEFCKQATSASGATHFWTIGLRIPSSKFRRTIDCFGLRQHVSSMRSASSSDVCGRPDDLRFSTLTLSLNCLNQRRIALPTARSLPNARQSLSSTVTMDLLSTIQMTKCALFCTVATVMTVAVLTTAQRVPYMRKEYAQNDTLVSN
jgi:hypothetical protein